jgi:glutathione S-transferase
MILIGQFDSPFTRRVGITMRLYNIAFEHNPWSVFGNADELANINPLIRVPTLVLDTGEALFETAAIIDYLDGLVPHENRLLPQTQPDRYRAQNIVALTSGVSDMAVRLFYELRLHDVPSDSFVARMTRQIQQALTVLDSSVPSSKTLDQAQIAIACMFRHLGECHPALTPKGHYPSIEKHCEALESHSIFIEISQAFIAPA